MRSRARAPLEVDEFGLRSSTAAPAATEARTHQRGNALLADQSLGFALLVGLVITITPALKGFQAVHRFPPHQES
jgi:hypothetical protein